MGSYNIHPLVCADFLQRLNFPTWTKDQYIEILSYWWGLPPSTTHWWSLRVFPSINDSNYYTRDQYNHLKVYMPQEASLQSLTPSQLCKLASLLQHDSFRTRVPIMGHPMLRIQKHLPTHHNFNSNVSYRDETFTNWTECNYCLLQGDGCPSCKCSMYV